MKLECLCALARLALVAADVRRRIVGKGSGPRCPPSHVGGYGEVFPACRDRFPGRARIFASMKTIITLFLTLSTVISTQARITRAWSYQELYDEADLVVIARPASTLETSERGSLPDFSPDVPFVGLSTEFDIKAVMKGDKTMKSCILHHYRLANPEEIMRNGPNLVSFDSKQHITFLLFLRREADGRYSPVSGPTDPALFSVLRVERLVNEVR